MGTLIELRPAQEGRFLTKDETAALLRMSRRWPTTMTVPEIADECGCSIHAVRYSIHVLRARGVELPPRHPAREQDSPVADRLEQMWRAGMSTPDIANELGWSTTSVSSRVARLRRDGRDLPHRQSIETPARRGKIVEMRARGMSMTAIGRELGISPQAVSKHLQAITGDRGRVSQDA